MIESNKIYNMDNLNLLGKIESEKIDLIYCDVLYNTGKKFKDYNDNLGTPKQAVEWYRPRLIEMWRVLKERGSIYIHCDWRLSHYLKVLMDELYGLSNFRNELIWCYQGRETVKKRYNCKHDTILFYTKGENYTFNYDEIREPYTEVTLSKFKLIDDDGRKYRIRHKDGRSDVGFEDDNTYRQYLDQSGVLPRDWFNLHILNQSSKERVDYTTQKPKTLLEKIIKVSSNKGDLVGDFFIGSGTTCVVAKELGRYYIGCDINEKAIHITNERLNKIS